MGSRCAFLALLWSALAFAPHGSAQLVVDRLWVDLASDGVGREDIVLANESDERYYITLTPSEIFNAGTADEKREIIANPEDLGLLISPSRLILEPGATRAVRIVSIADPPQHDRVYRLRVSPQVSDVDAPEVSAGETGVNIKVLVGYDILIVARPADPQAQIAKKSVEGRTLLVNTGNTSALLTDGKACTSDGSKCAPISDARLYAGGELLIETDIVNPKVEYRRRVLAKGESDVVTY